MILRNPDPHMKLKDPDPDLHMKLKDPDPDLHMKLKDQDPDLHMKLKDPDPDLHMKLKDSDPDLHMKLKGPDPDRHMKLRDPDPGLTIWHEVPVLKLPHFVNKWQGPDLQQREKLNPYGSDAEPLRCLAVLRIPDPEPIFLRA